MEKIIGFTGTAEGMTEDQKYGVLTCFLELLPDKFHHGMCIGADTQAHNLIRDYVQAAWIIGHPPINKKSFVFSECDEYRQPKEYLVRDRDIVTESQMLIAAPLQDVEVVRSGSWTTVRYARKQNKDVWIVKRDGTLVKETNAPQLLEMMK